MFGKRRGTGGNEMTRAFAAAAAAALAALVLAFASSAAQAPRPPATLDLGSLAPLTVTGRHFGSREAVLLPYLSADGTSRLASAQANRGGRFRAVFRLRLPRCASFTVRAAGTAGSRAILQ